MPSVPYPSSPIDPYSKHSLHDVVSGEMDDPGDSTEYLGLHIVCQTGGRYIVQPDGHLGDAGEILSEDYDDVLELVHELNGIALEWHNHLEHGTKEALVEFAGKIMTSDPEKAEEQPEVYFHVPDEPSAEPA